MLNLPPPPPDLIQDAALFLDFDGTLVELADRPDSIAVSPQLPSLLQRLAQRLQGRVAILSGRSIADLEAHLDCKGMAVAGSHGLELRLADGTALPLAVPPGFGEVRSEIAAFAAATQGLLVEEKPAGIALHYRQAPEAEIAAIALMERIAADHDLLLQHGKMVVELRPPGADKGDALRTFMAEPPFAGARPVVVGDDLTDEHAFRAAAALSGAAVLVGPERETAATYRLPSVAAVADWLGGAA